MLTEAFVLCLPSMICTKSSMHETGLGILKAAKSVMLNWKDALLYVQLLSEWYKRIMR